MSYKIKHAKETLRLNTSLMPIALYSGEQVYAIEQTWFDQGYSSFALMQQAAWQMTQRIIELDDNTRSKSKRAVVWVGQGNNGGDGWLIALYLQQAGWQVQVITIGIEVDTIVKNDNMASESESEQISDALKARNMALSSNCSHECFDDTIEHRLYSADIFIDAIFGIGLDRVPTGSYKQAIITFNRVVKRTNALVISVDIPSGLVASTGEVFERYAIEADMTLCLVARKLGLHTKDGMDYAGQIIDIPLIPFSAITATATLYHKAYPLCKRQQNSHKGSYGQVLIIGGNRIDSSQGMGGAAILAASSAMAAGTGKITVACHSAFHGAVITSLPDAMTIDLHDKEGVRQLIKDASVVAIGMGLGRDEPAYLLFITYIETAIEQQKPIIIDADGLYHLASLHDDNHLLVEQLKAYSEHQLVYLTPHSGEAAKLLDKTAIEIESNRLAAIKECARVYGGHWVLKGAGTLILEEGQVSICAIGNPGMATAGMGDVLSGLIAGLTAQQDLDAEQHSLLQAVLIHAMAGDIRIDDKRINSTSHFGLSVGERGLQAQDMPDAIRHAMHLLTQ